METTLISFLTSLVGEIPPEMESVVYVFAIFILLYIIDSFFVLLTSLFGVTKWRM